MRLSRSLLRGLFTTALCSLVACVNPGLIYSDVAVATLGDPMADGGIAGDVSISDKSCAVQASGTYLLHFVQQASGTCGPIADNYVSGTSLGAAPYCPRGSGSITTASVHVDGGTGCSVTLSLEGCDVSSDTAITSTHEVGIWSSDDATFTGTTTITATTPNGPCMSSYDLTFTRQ